MKRFVCVDGLGGHPETTFGLFKHFLEIYGFKVTLVDVANVKTMQDRISTTEKAVTQEYGEVVLVGMCAGAAAVCTVAEKFSKVKGVILLSPVVPIRVKYFATSQLARIIRSKFRQIWQGEMVELNENEYISLIEPVAEELRGSLIATRQPFSGKEGKQLLLPGSPIPKHGQPTLYAYGGKDQLLQLKALRAYLKVLVQDKLDQGPRRIVIPIFLPKSGHLVLASDDRDILFNEILDFTHKL